MNLPHLRTVLTAPRFGITRLADLTGLDEIGLPVWAAIRPGAWSLSQSQGKGLTDEQAQVSALMEAAETALAETAERLVWRSGTQAELATEGVGTVALPDLLKCRDPTRAATLPVQWLIGRGLITGAEIAVPLEAVSLDFRIDGPCDAQAFTLNSVGLAAHRFRDQAVLHGLLEAIEYDAVALSAVWPGVLECSPRPDLDSMPDDLQGAIDMVQAAGLDPDFRDISSDLGLPCVICWLQDRHHPRLRVHAGHACRFTLAEAALAALLEAVQSRLTDISGAREDISANDYNAVQASPVSDVPRTGSLARPIRSPGGLDEILGRFTVAGLPEPLVVDLSGPDDGLHCVSMICAGLEVGPARDGYRTGPRARHRLIRHALGLP